MHFFCWEGWLEHILVINTIHPSDWEGLFLKEARKLLIMPPKLWIGAFELLMLVCKLWKVNSFPLIHVNSIFEPYRLCNMPFLMSVVQFFFHSVVSAYVCVMLWCHSKWVFVLVNFWWPTCNVQCIFSVLWQMKNTR